ITAFGLRTLPTETVNAQKAQRHSLLVLSTFSSKLPFTSRNSLFHTSYSRRSLRTHLFAFSRHSRSSLQLNLNFIFLIHNKTLAVFLNVSHLHDLQITTSVSHCWARVGYWLSS